jgi:hypothetical protein
MCGNSHLQGYTVGNFSTILLDYKHIFVFLCGISSTFYIFFSNKKSSRMFGLDSDPDCKSDLGNDDLRPHISLCVCTVGVYTEEPFWKHTLLYYANYYFFQTNTNLFICILQRLYEADLVFRTFCDLGKCHPQVSYLLINVVRFFKGLCISEG